MGRQQTVCGFQLNYMLLYSFCIVLLYLIYDTRNLVDLPASVSSQNTEEEGTLFQRVVFKNISPKPVITEGPAKDKVIQNITHNMEYNIDDTNDFYQLGEESIFFYSAYLDIRFGKQYLTIFGMQTGSTSLNINACLHINGTDYCGDHVRVSAIYDFWPSQKQEYHAYMYYWRIEEMIGIKTLRMRKYSKTLKIRVSVVNAYKPTIMPLRIFGDFENYQNRSQLAICVKSIWGPVDANRLIEWIEMNRELQVNKIVLYDGVTVGKATSVIDYYKDKGLVDQINFSYLLRMHTLLRNDPMRSKLVSDDLLLEQVYLISINDCIYRYGNQYKYILMLDIDEVILPRDSHTLLNQTLKLHKEYPNAAAFSYYTAWHFEEFGEVAEGVNNLYMQRHLKRTVVMNSQPKSIINTDLSITANWHSVILIPTMTDDGNIAAQWNKYGFVHHFRNKCKYERDKCHKIMTDSVEVDVDLPRYKISVYGRVKEVQNVLHFT